MMKKRSIAVASLVTCTATTSPSSIAFAAEKPPAVNLTAFAARSVGHDATYYIATTNQTVSYSPRDGSVFKQPLWMEDLVLQTATASTQSKNDVRWLSPRQYPEYEKVLWDFTGNEPSVGMRIAVPPSKSDFDAYINWAIDTLYRMNQSLYSKSNEKILGFTFGPSTIMSKTFLFIGNYQVQMYLALPSVFEGVAANAKTGAYIGGATEKHLAPFEVQLERELASKIFS